MYTRTRTFIPAFARICVGYQKRQANSFAHPSATMFQDIGQIITAVSQRDNGSVATITISRPTKLNCLNTHLITQIPIKIHDLTSKVSDLICIILTGAGEKAFIGGADLAEMARFANPAAARAFITRIHRACESIRKCPVPVLGRINGFALGAGLEIAAACDVKIASKNAVFGMPEVRMGIPSVAEAALLPGLIGWGRTRRLLLLGERIPAEEALQWGLVEKVVDAQMLDQALEEWVQCLKAASRKAIRNQKELIGRWEQMSSDAGIETGIDHFGRAFEPTLGDAQEGGGYKLWETEPGRLMGEFVEQQKRKRSAKL